MNVITSLAALFFVIMLRIHFSKKQVQTLEFGNG